MDQQQQHQAGNPSPNGDGQSHHIKQDQAASLAQYHNGLGLIDPSNLSFDTSYQSTDLSDAPPSFNLTQDIGQNQQHIQDNSYMGDPQGGFTDSLLSTYNNDFMQFPSTADGQFNNSASSPFSGDNIQYGNGVQEGSMANQHGMAVQHLTPDGQQSGSAQHSPAFNQTQFSPPSRGNHSRHTSLTPQDAYLLGPGQVGVDWTQTMGMQGPHFRQHQRTPSASEFSDVSSVGGYSSVAPSPQIVSVEHFADSMRQQGSPENEQLLAELQASIPNISISDQGTHGPSPSQHSHHTLGRTPIHSPAISPRIMPAQMADVNPHQQYMLQGPNNSFGPPASYGSMQQMGEQFPQLQSSPDPQTNQFQQLQAPPQIQVDSTYAPSSGMQTMPTNGRPLDADSLTPPTRGSFLLQCPAICKDDFANAVVFLQ